MKKIFLLFVAATLAACSAEPIEKEGLTELDATSGKIKASVSYEGLEIPDFETISYDLIKYHANDPSKDELVGKIFVSNDCNNLYFKVEGSEEINLGFYTAEADFPKINGNKQNVSPELTFTEENFTDGLYTTPVGELEQIYVFVNIGGHTWGGNLPWGNALYFSYELQLENCAALCTYGKGYWRNHSNDNPGEQENVWPVVELDLGNTAYDQTQLNEILDAPNNEGNNLVILSKHLIAAKLNVANGAGNSEIEVVISDSDALIGDLVVLENSFSDEQKNTANELKGILENFNESSPCEDDSTE